MAFPTVEQKDCVTHLTSRYGEPDMVKIEFTSAAYGLMWLQWEGPELDGLNRRNLFIKPNGERLAWRPL